MLVTRKNIIAATLKIHDMSPHEAFEKLLGLLDSHPTIILRALEIGVPAAPPKLYKVVLINHGINKINVIKTFREIVGAGLADAKNWSEGQTVYDRPSGVFGEKLTKEDADRLLARVNQSLTPAGVKAEIVPQETTVKPLPYTWNH